MRLIDYLPAHSEQDYDYVRHGTVALPYCRDDRARLRWRIAKHPLVYGAYLLRPPSGRLHVNGGVLQVS